MVFPTWSATSRDRTDKALLVNLYYRNAKPALTVPNEVSFAELELVLV